VLEAFWFDSGFDGTEIASVIVCQVSLLWVKMVWLLGAK
jgi:hypothetical protein